MIDRTRVIEECRAALIGRAWSTIGGCDTCGYGGDSAIRVDELNEVLNKLIDQPLDKKD
jgi:uncharacterized Fe-S cluster-containing MiaB family protein